MFLHWLNTIELIIYFHFCCILGGTTICLISVEYHLELRIAITFYREHHFLPKEHK
jgi:hypothetical protein